MAKYLSLVTEIIGLLYKKYSLFSLQYLKQSIFLWFKNEQQDHTWVGRHFLCKTYILKIEFPRPLTWWQHVSPSLNACIFLTVFTQQFNNFLLIHLLTENQFNHILHVLNDKFTPELINLQWIFKFSLNENTPLGAHIQFIRNMCEYIIVA